jgi:hypothetical protein
MKSRLPEAGEASNRRRLGRAEPTLKHLGRPRPAEKRLLVAVAWSSDERWRAIAQEQKVLLVGPHRSIVLPLRALDLAWTRDLS